MGTPQTTIYSSVLIASIVLGLLIVYFFISVIRQLRINLELRKKNILNEISGLEKERSRIASDLHDELGPLLSAVKMKINSFDLADSGDYPELEKTNDHIDIVIKRMREISFDLMPSSLLKKGLRTALNEYFSFLKKEYTIHFIFINEADSSINENKAVNIYRIVQEVIHNSIKHSKATEILTEIKIVANKISLAMSDNGTGFNYKEMLGQDSGIGLNSINNRVEIAGGRMSVNSSHDQGTKYYFEIPL
jgi:signal transduction histidine kinase